MVPCSSTGQFPSIAAMANHVSHDPESTLGGCEFEFEFEFGLDRIRDDLDRKAVSLIT